MFDNCEAFKPLEAALYFHDHVLRCDTLGAGYRGINAVERAGVPDALHADAGHARPGRKPVNGTLPGGQRHWRAAWGLGGRQGCGSFPQPRQDRRLPVQCRDWGAPILHPVQGMCPPKIFDSRWGGKGD